MFNRDSEYFTIFHNCRKKDIVYTLSTNQLGQILIFLVIDCGELLQGLEKTILKVPEKSCSN